MEGLTHAQAKEALKTYGLNKIDVRKRFRALSIFLSQVPSTINFILFVAFVFSLIIGDLLDGFFILAILFLTIIFGFVQEYKAEKAIEKLKSYITPTSRVIRNGEEIKISTEEIVPRDLVVLCEGSYVPSDGKIIKSTYLETDESMLTGESLPVIKKVNDQVFSGSLILKGKALMIVEKTGMQTRFGQIAKAMGKIEENKTPLQKNLSSLGKTVSIIAVIVAASLIPIGILQGQAFFNLVLLSISVAVAAIPEGLPAAITAALAIGAIRMAKQNAVVRKIPAIETLGSVQFIITDKTGTLTENKMQIKEMYLHDKSNKELLTQAMVIGNTSTLIKKADGKFDVVGDKTDGAHLLWLEKEGYKIEDIKDLFEIKDEFIFDVKEKIITTVCKNQSSYFTFVRGAPETLLKKSTLNKEEKEKITKLYEAQAKKGLRIIGFGFKKENKYQKTKRDSFEENLTFLGFVSLNDPLREEVKESVEKAKRAGIKTILVTGDNELTALAIAKEAEIISQDEDVITGDQLTKISEEELSQMILKTSVFARTTPEDKLRLVNSLKKQNYVVAVTGDGVNDALALKQADVGIAMGEKGTDVAKEASDIVLTDDNYSTLVKAVFEGRTIYKNIVKSITYLLSGNLSEITLVFFSALLSLPIPLLPTQILWINLVTDGLPALALASDNKNSGGFNDMPRDPSSSILSKNRLFIIACIGLSMSLLMLCVYSFLNSFYSQRLASIVVFNLIIFLHLILVLIINGSVKRISKFLIFSILISGFLQILINVVPSLRSIFHLF